MVGVVYRLSSKTPSGRIFLKPESWRILALINGESSLMEIARTAGMDERDVIYIIDYLCQAGVLEASRNGRSKVVQK